MKLKHINSAVISEANWYKKKKYQYTNELLKDFYADMGDDAENWFISFTELEKLGINPKNSFNTPTGIYSYPLEYFVKIGSIKNMPFANHHPFTNLFRIKDDGTYIKSSDSEDDIDYFMRKLDHLGYDTNVNLSKYDIRSSFSKLWLTTKEIAKNPIKWGNILRELGIDGFIDDMGTSTIHPSEPTQAVFLSKKVIDKNIRLINREDDNPYYDLDVDVYDKMSDFLNVTVLPSMINGNTKSLEHFIKTISKYKNNSILDVNSIIHFTTDIIRIVHLYRLNDMMPKIYNLYQSNGVERELSRGMLMMTVQSDRVDMFMKYYEYMEKNIDLIDIKNIVRDGADRILKFLFDNNDLVKSLDDQQLWDLYDYGTYKIKKLIKDILNERNAAKNNSFLDSLDD